jgi:hypothetical protein
VAQAVGDITDRLANEFRDAIDRRVATGADIDDLALSYPGAPRGQDVGAHDVVDMREIPGLCTVPVMVRGTPRERCSRNFAITNA